MTLPTFPALPGLAWPFKVTPLWSTLKQAAISGRETRLGLWSYPLRRYELAYDFLRSASAYAEWQQMVGFYNSVGGARDVFQFSDANDNQAAAQPFGEGDGATTAFQLVRTLGGFTEPVFALAGTPAVEVAGTPTAVTVGSGGVVTFATAPAGGAALTWSGGYYWLCRFDDDDKVEFDQFNSVMFDLKKLSFTTVKI